MTVQFKRLTYTAKIPCYAHPGDSGMDICADEDGEIMRGGSYTFPTGIAAIIPDGYELQVRPRSGLAARCGVHAIFGTVDEGYRGEIKVTLFSQLAPYFVRRGDRIAQLVLCPVTRANIAEVNDIAVNTERGDNGFGSTGK